MSLSTTSNIKVQITNTLAAKAPVYFDCLHKFISGRISRTEFDDTLKPILDVPYLIQLHNALIISLFDARSHKRPITPPPDLPKPPPRKRRRALPYQGPDIPDDDFGFRSSRLKRWTLSVGKNERERVRNLKALPLTSEPRREITEEIARERAIRLPPERGDPAGSRLPIQLASSTRAPTVQHIADRVNLISAQNNLGTPSRNVSTLMHLACEVKLKQLITHALTLTTDSLAISSVSTSSSSPSHSHSHSAKVLTTAAFETLFTVAPADLPNKSAAAMRLALGEREEDEDEYSVSNRNGDIVAATLLKGDGAAAAQGHGTNLGLNPNDYRWQIVALLAERSAVKEVLKGAR